MTVAWPDMVRVWGELKVPEGWEVAQAAVEGILLLPLEGRDHAAARKSVFQQLFRAPECGTYAVGQRFAASLAGVGIFVPDLSVIGVESLRGNVTSMAMKHFLVIVEITTPESAVNDRTKKWRAYARGGIPQYLLIDAYDPGGPTVTLFTNPGPDVYRDAERVAFGGRVALRAPVSAVIDTAALSHEALN